jgi:hypothetical protein
MVWLCMSMGKSSSLGQSSLMSMKSLMTWTMYPCCDSSQASWALMNLWFLLAGSSNLLWPLKISEILKAPNRNGSLGRQALRRAFQSAQNDLESSFGPMQAPLDRMAAISEGKIFLDTCWIWMNMGFIWVSCWISVKFHCVYMLTAPKSIGC